MTDTPRPVSRSSLRLALGTGYYGWRQKILWRQLRPLLSCEQREDPLPYRYAAHKTILLRQLKDVDMWMQHNKIVNLTIAAKRINGLILRPGEIFSYWKRIGKPTKAKGYLDGMILRNGTFRAGTGGGLCQLSNLLFWMTSHTPLTVIERHRHGYDVFPDSNRTQPFGSGATCFYPHGDLMIQNQTADTYQLLVCVRGEYLEGEWRVSAAPAYRFEVVERNHEIRAEYWGGYTRHNELYQQKFDLDGRLLEESLLVKNAAVMMYAPFLEEHPQPAGDPEA